MFDVSIFGKEGCYLCENRLEFFSKLKKMNPDRTFKIDYYNVNDSSGLVAFSMQNLVTDIPSVILCGKNGVIKVWNGATEVPTTKEVMDILKENPNE